MYTSMCEICVHVYLCMCLWACATVQVFVSVNAGLGGCVHMNACEGGDLYAASQ